MIKLNVWLTQPDGSRIFCGEIVCQPPDDQGRIKGAYRYTPEFMENTKAFPLDPVSLPLSSQIYETERPAGVFSVFEDSLPDDWGRRLLARKANLQRTRQTVPELLAVLGGSGMGALSYFQRGIEPNEKNYAGMLELETLLDTAERFEAGRDIEDDKLNVLFQAGSSPGGGRPKALIRQDDGSQWLAKFPSARDRYELVPIEAATMALAQKAGLNVPETAIIECGSRKVFFIKRFDVTNTAGRRHMISMKTLLKAEHWYNAGYSDLFEIIRKFSSQPELDIPAIYRQMVFNALIGNTDDHLKNFMMLHDDSGYYLSPAYDLLPDIAHQREHVLYFQHSYINPGINILVELGKKAGVKNAAAIVHKILDVIGDWKNEFTLIGVPEKQIQNLAWNIERQISKQ